MNDTKTRRKLTEPLLLIRKRLVNELWREHKDFLTMQDIARIFNTPLGSIYNYLKEHNEKGRK